MTLSPTIRRSRIYYGIAMLLVLGLGMLWRSRLIPLPYFISKYGGDALWTLMIFLGFAFLWKNLPTFKIFLLAVLFSWVIEFSQLYHAPWIDHIRSMRLGKLILGSTFNWPDLIAYALGAGLGALAEKFLIFRRV